MSPLGLAPRRARRIAATLVVIAGLAAAPAPASAQKTVTVGLYAPTTPFGGPSDRLQYVTRLATHLEKKVGGVRVVGRVFARASDFRSAARRGQLQLAVVDAPYAAARGLPYRILASTARGGSSTGPWYLIAAPGVGDVGDLAGKVVAMSRTGHRELDFLTRVLLEDEVDKGYFASVTRTPDPFSAVTMVKLGRAAAALVPSGVSLPSGVRRVLTLRPIAWPMFVALPGVDDATADRFAAAVRGFGDGPLPGTSGPDAAAYTQLRARFSTRAKDPIMVVDRPSRAGVARLLEGRTFAIERPPIWDLLGSPPEP